MPESEQAADLAGFLQAAGSSLTEAQRGLVGDIPAPPTGTAISEVNLEVKAALETKPDGAMLLQPISAKDLRERAIPEGLVSTVRVRLVAVSMEPAVEAPKRTSTGIVEELQKRPDIRALVDILDDIRLEPVFVPENRRWLVTARDAQGRVVREVVVPDEAPES